jgi:hypothetical protein
VRRRGLRRFLLEVIFLAGVAAALTVADLRPAAVVALMAAALLVVWLFEWASWLDEPHYGRGLPPRYYVPHVALPPPRPVEQYRDGGYPILQPDDAPTFVASTQEWAAALDWPVVEGEDTRISAAAETAVVPLPPVRELEETVAAGAPAIVHRPEHAPGREGTAPVRPLVPSEPGELLPLTWEPRPSSTVVHHVDPLSGGGRRRFLRRRGGDEHVVEVLDGPAPDRVLPSRLRSGGTETVD